MSAVLVLLSVWAVGTAALLAWLRRAASPPLPARHPARLAFRCEVCGMDDLPFPEHHFALWHDPRRPVGPEDSDTWV